MSPTNALGVIVIGPTGIRYCDREEVNSDSKTEDQDEYGDCRLTITTFAMNANICETKIRRVFLRS